MSKEYREMYDSIRAGSDIKNKTVEKMVKAANMKAVKSKKNKAGKAIAFKPVFRLACACLAALVLVGVGAGVYTVQAQDSYITVDSKAMVGLSVNRWNKVIAVESKNQEADKMLEELKLKGMDYDRAVEAILEYESKNGMVSEDSILTISVDCNREQRVQEMQSKVDRACENYKNNCNEQRGNYGNSGAGAGNGGAGVGNGGAGSGNGSQQPSTECIEECTSEPAVNHYSHGYQHGKQNR